MPTCSRSHMDTIPTKADGRPGDRSISDAVAIGRAGLHSKHLRMVRPDDEMVALKLLSDRRHELVASRTQSVCRLHRLIGELIPGGTPRALTAERAEALVNGLNVSGAAGTMRIELALNHIDDIKPSHRRDHPEDPRGGQRLGHHPHPHPRCWAPHRRSDPR